MDAFFIENIFVFFVKQYKNIAKFVSFKETKPNQIWT